MTVYSTSFEVEDEATAKRIHLALNRILCTDSARISNYKARITPDELQGSVQATGS
jgi:hypothetical protein